MEKTCIRRKALSLLVCGVCGLMVEERKIGF